MVCLFVLCQFVFFFFFKQKTAYEMRISDWSSDVCSSDLIRSLCCCCRRLGRRMSSWSPAGTFLPASPADLRPVFVRSFVRRPGVRCSAKITRARTHLRAERPAPPGASPDRGASRRRRGARQPRKEPDRQRGG